MKYSLYHGNQFFGKVGYHLVFWAVFICYELAVSYSYNHGFAPFSDYFITYALNISLFYVNSYFLYAYLTDKKQTYLYAIVIILFEIASYLLLKYFFALSFILLGISTRDILGNIEIFVRNSVWRATYFIGLSAALGFSMLAESLRQKTIRLEFDALTNEKEKLKNDLMLLRSQINPHFIFNTLGLVHNKVFKHSLESADIVIMLSEMMRYALEEPYEDGKVPAANEIQYIKNYIEINRHRYEKELYVDFIIHGDFSGERIPPLLLLTLVENALKYGYIDDPQKPIIISVSNNSDSMIFTISNYKQLNIKGTGVGLTNLSQRLEKMYGKNYTFNINETVEVYRVTLILNK